MTIGVLVTNYNSWDLAIACAEAHRRLHGNELSRILLVDDASSTPLPLKSGKGFEIVRNDRNIGFAATLNKGVRLIGTDIIVIFDADAIPLTPYFESVKRDFLAEPQLGLLGFQLVDRDQHLTTTIHNVPGCLSLMLGQRLDSWRQHVVHQTETTNYITMAAIAVRRRAFDDVGGFDERLNWIDVDLDFNLKLFQSTWMSRVQFDILAQHSGGGTPMQTADRVLEFYRSRWFLLRKHDRIRWVTTTKYIILMRISIEWAFMILFGRLFFHNRAKRLDKLRSREALIRNCWRQYH